MKQVMIVWDARLVRTVCVSVKLFEKIILTAVTAVRRQHAVLWMKIVRARRARVLILSLRFQAGKARLVMTVYLPAKKFAARFVNRAGIAKKHVNLVRADQRKSARTRVGVPIVVHARIPELHRVRKVRWSVIFTRVQMANA